MPEDSWRGTARVIAYIDLALAIITALTVLCTLFAICSIKRNAERMGRFETDRGAYYIMWISVVIGAILVALNIISISELIRATAEDIGPTASLKKSLVWLIVTIVGMILTIPNALCSRSWTNCCSGFLNIGLRLYFIYVVCRYRSEMKDVLHN